MKPKQIFMLLAILALLAAGIVLKQSCKRPEITTQEYTPLNLSFPVARVGKITLSAPFQRVGSGSKAGTAIQGSEVELIKEDGRWIVPAVFGTRADQNKIEGFLTAIQKAQGELRGNRQELLSDFAITDDKGFHIKLAAADGKSVLGLVIGAKKPGPRSVFVRQEGSSTVYLTETDLLAGMGLLGDPSTEELQADFWVSKNIAVFGKAKINRVEITDFQAGAAKKLVLNGKEGILNSEPSGFPFALAMPKVGQYLSLLGNTQAEKVLDPQAKDFGFARPRLIVTVGYEDNSEMNITVGNPGDEENTFYVRSSAAAVVFLVSKPNVESLVVDAAYFFKDNPLEINAAKMEKLTIHAAGRDVEWNPSKKSSPAQASYLDNLKNFHADKVWEARQTAFGQYWIEIQPAGATAVILDVAEISFKDHKEYAAQKRGNPFVLSISEDVFKSLFENLDALKAVS